MDVLIFVEGQLWWEQTCRTLVQLRHESGLSQAELGRRAGGIWPSQMHVDEFLERSPPVKIALGWMAALGQRLVLGQDHRLPVLVQAWTPEFAARLAVLR